MNCPSPCRSSNSPRSRSLAAAGLLLLAACWGVVPSLHALVSPMPDWTQRFHLGGQAAFRVQDGGNSSQLERNNGASIYSAGLVFDVDLAPNWSFWYDTNLVHEAQDRSTFREQLYLRRDNVMDWSWLNLKLGRAFMPYGEDYLHWNQIQNPLASWSVAFPWALDEGVMAFGDILPQDKLSYALSVQNGNSTFSFDENPNKTVALRLTTKPWSWLRFSSSFLNLGKQGNATTAGSAEFWLSGFHISPVGTTKAPSGASTGKTVSGHLYEQNLTLAHDLGEAWLNFGYFHHIDGGGSKFDRYIRYYTAQLLGHVPNTEKKAYVAGRYSKIETMSATEGYRFAGSMIAIAPVTSPYAPYNYDQRDLYRWSLGAGYWLQQNILAKAEFSMEDSHLISAAKPFFTRHRNFVVGELAVRF